MYQGWDTLFLLLNSAAEQRKLLLQATRKIRELFKFMKFKQALRSADFSLI